jgi:hypothetical protein
MIAYWLQPPELGRKRSLGELLTAIPDLLDEELVPVDGITKEPLSIDSPPAEVHPSHTTPTPPHCYLHL